MFTLNPTAHHLAHAPLIKDNLTVRKPMRLADGKRLSVQASEHHYCAPRPDGTTSVAPGDYTSVEVAYAEGEAHDMVNPTADPLLSEAARVQWAARSDGAAGSVHVFAFVPVALVNALVEAHGGLDPDHYPQP